ncbi:MAG: hypothetical protein QM767_27995 [Anaeromyxobacter sp.]
MPIWTSSMIWGKMEETTPFSPSILATLHDELVAQRDRHAAGPVEVFDFAEADLGAAQVAEDGNRLVVFGGGLADLRVSMARCSSKEPWEKLRRQTSTPSRKRATSVSTVATAGPIVATILVRIMN